MFCVLTSYLSEKLEYVCCFSNFIYVSCVFQDADADTYSTLMINCFYVILLLIVHF